MSDSRYQAQTGSSSVVHCEKNIEMLELAEKETDVGLVAEVVEGAIDEVDKDISPYEAMVNEVDVENEEPEDAVYSRLFSPPDNDHDQDVHAEEYSSVYLNYSHIFLGFLFCVLFL